LPEIGVLDRRHQETLGDFVHISSITNSRTLVALTDVFRDPGQVLVVEFPLASVQPYVVGWSPGTFVVSISLRLGNEFISAILVFLVFLVFVFIHFGLHVKEAVDCRAFVTSLLPLAATAHAFLFLIFLVLFLVVLFSPFALVFLVLLIFLPSSPLLATSIMAGSRLLFLLFFSRR
jgi:hypothetical protein